MKYTDQEWYKDMFSEFKLECKKELDISDGEMKSFLNWATDVDEHPKKSLVTNITQNPKQTFKDWKDLSQFVKSK
jgi:hypothetical protein